MIVADHQVVFCRYEGCGREIVWAVTTAKGKPIPLDPAPNPAGNVEIVGGPQPVVAKVYKGPPGMFDTWVAWMPHHATCAHVGGNPALYIPRDLPERNPSVVNQAAKAPPQLVQTNHPWTSQAMALVARPGIRRRVAAALLVAGDRGLTDDEIHDAGTGTRHRHSTATRRGELCDAGLVEGVPFTTRPTPDGNEAVVWRWVGPTTLGQPT